MKRIGSVCAGVCIAIVAATIAHLFIPQHRASPIAFTIETGERARSIAERLATAGIIRNRIPFLVALVISGQWNRLQPGTYSFPVSVRMIDVIGMVGVSNGPREITVTIPEGWTLQQIVDALAAQGVVDRDAFLRSATVDQWKSSFPFLAQVPSGASLEGYLFPDTYRFYAGSDAREVVRRFLTRFSEVVPAHARSFDTITLASIVEREVSRRDDRRTVSAIFQKRLKAGIPLQADSTVNYITGGNSRSISNAERATDSLYNTYRYAGLPPGPIANPGLDAVTAALTAQKTPYWYFLSGIDGTTHFARNLDEHNQQRRLYLR